MVAFRLSSLMLSNACGELLKLVDVPKEPGVVNPIKPVLHRVTTCTC